MLCTLADDGIHDARSLVAAMESLQSPIEDFRCEFEGSRVFMGAGAESFEGRLDENGLFDTFGGVFIWKRGGEVSSDALRRGARQNAISRELILVRPRDRVFELYTRPSGDPLGRTEIKDLETVNSNLYNSPLKFFLIEAIKRYIDKDSFKTSVADDQIDGRPVKALSVVMTFKGHEEIPDALWERYWIDLHRNGQVVRMETYGDGVRRSRCDVSLKSFKVGGESLWMPVAADVKQYVARVDGQSVVFKDPTAVSSIYVLDGTMQFNKHPSEQVFTAKYRPGTPISDHVRQLQYEFGQSSLKPRPTKAEIEAMLQNQLAAAEAQKNELVAAPLDEGFNWWALSVAGMGAAVLASLTLLWMQRRAG